MATIVPDIAAHVAAYRTLDLEVRASVRAIRVRYLELARLHHPDKWPAGSPEQDQVANRMRAVNAAYLLVQNAPLRHHVFHSTAVDEIPFASPLTRPLGVTAETLGRLGVGATAGAVISMSLHVAGVPGVALYAPALVLLLALAFTSTSNRASDVVTLLWWW